ncbi:Osmotically activated L-carnitine/choline ABC transporter, substrate-binding protein OpuCC [Pediococcus damnosus]|uniref:Osmotically activated L-carnitine/choline ABC transporter, substrate-binding protein OpuCC n=1 Tax=Pediococcus damnosus TaxID=51663 RepID=A0A143AVS2_9LACO|nr:osmoprotectant ABC transporter substrate-binding protein [Pediococcus damnosus]AMV61418.1 Osmotically activated L-carnitine/choline ABC transporter, substrate-binding protein OpuCC [Pediococcus damnosus]AMV62224.1 Osmotically activated L-carnitine/choline ABC transporter, substrate-binding protein OpuCC [Pediococcus damnosus]AMV65780.1 Osmotically activated L-carnitine/choline ABC transporter, substrate-binding protein OpuCC [Pediococcus damnosus]AMV67919.1 Osmotically activated L-carnitine/
MKKISRFFKAGILVLVSSILLSGCGFPGLNSSSKDTVRIAAQNTSEQQIMAYMISDLIEHDTNLKTTLINNLGSGSVSFQAVKNGDADISAIRYNGTDLTTIFKQAPVKDPKLATEKVRKIYKDKYHMTYFPSYGFADTYAFMVTGKLARKENLENVSDLKRLAPNMTVGADQIWVNRKGDGYDGFAKTYGFRFQKVYPMQIGLVYSAVQSRKMNAVLGYSTDGRIKSYDLKVLKDNKQFFPPYTASPMASDKILKEHPELKPVLLKLKGKISLSTMQKLNAEADNDLIEPQVVAKRFLEQHNYFDGKDGK